MPLVTRFSDQGNVFKQGTEPLGWLNGDLWVDTGDGVVSVNISGTATPLSSIPGIETLTNKTITDLEITAGIRLEAISKTFEHYFTGDSVDVIWTFNDIAGSNSLTMNNGIDSGLRITTGALTNNRGTINFNDIRHFDPANCTIYGVITNEDDVNTTFCGISDGDRMISATTSSVGIDIGASNSFISLGSSNGASASLSDSDVAPSSAITPFKIICNATNLRLFLLVAGVWTLKVTKTTLRPTAACQPELDVITLENAAHFGEILYMRVQND